MAQTATVESSAKKVFVAREPVLDRNRKTFGYQLLFHPAPDAVGQPIAEDYATARVISDALLSIGLDALTDGHRAFLSVRRHLLMEGVPSVLPPDRVVLELGDDIEPDEDVLAVCRHLKRAGYALAIDHALCDGWSTEILHLVSFLKVDFARADTPELRAKLPLPVGTARPRAIAVGIDSEEKYATAAGEGFELFQGYFFGTPVIKEGREIQGNQIANLRLLQALNNPNLSVHQLEDLIKHDPALCYRILRTVNSARFALRTTVKSVRDALVLLGRDRIRRWASLWAFAGLSDGAHSELMTMSMIRARCCEILAGGSGDDDAAAEGFLVGMCSMLESILGQPMAVVLAELPLAPETRAALLGEDNSRRRLLDCAIAYERGQWDKCERLAVLAKINVAKLPSAYAEALQWARELTNNKAL